MPLAFVPFVPRRRHANRAALLPADVRHALDNAPPPPLATPLMIGAAVGAVTALALGLISWAALPDRIPTHFGPSGRVDDWGGKGTLIIFPIMALFLFAMMTLLTRSPATYNYPFPITKQNAARQATLAMGLIAWLRFATIWLMTYLEYGVIAAAKNETAGLGVWFMPAILLLVAGPVIVYFLAAWRGR